MKRGGARWSGGVLVALAIGALAGCADPYYGACDTDADCGDGYSCLSLDGTSACVPPCATDADCGVVEARGDVYCAVIGGCLVACVSNVDCPGNAACDDVGACVRRTE